MFLGLLATDGANTTWLIRLMVGAVFLSEGIQKFLFAGELGAGHHECAAFWQRCLKAKPALVLLRR